MTETAPCRLDRGRGAGEVDQHHASEGAGMAEHPRQRGQQVVQQRPRVVPPNSPDGDTGVDTTPTAGSPTLVGPAFVGSVLMA